MKVFCERFIVRKMYEGTNVHISMIDVDEELPLTNREKNIISRANEHYKRVLE